VFLTQFTKSRAVKENSVCGLFGPSAKVPVVGWKEPRPTKHIARSNCLNNSWTFFSICVALQDNSSFAQEIKPVRRVPFLKNDLSRREVGLQCTICEDLEVMCAEPSEEGMLRYLGQQFGHYSALRCRRTSFQDLDFHTLKSSELSVTCCPAFGI